MAEPVRRSGQVIATAMRVAKVNNEGVELEKAGSLRAQSKSTGLRSIWMRSRRLSTELRLGDLRFGSLG